MARHLTEEHAMDNEISNVKGEIIDEEDGTEKNFQNAEDSGFPFLITSVKGEAEDSDHVYKCGQYRFVHNLKHEVERHITDKHAEKKSQLGKVPSKILIDRSAQLEDKNSSLIDEINTALKDAILIVNDKNECFEDTSVEIFGPFGSPLNNMYSCPLCSKFNSVFEADVAHHLYQELEYYRYRCPTCSLTSITFTFMCDHSTKKHKNWDHKTIVELPKNLQIESWVKKVLEFQKSQMSNDPREEAAKDCKESQKFVEYEIVVVGSEDEKDSTVNIVSEEEPSEISLSTTSNLIQTEKKALQKCPHCPYQCIPASDMRKHEMRHWLQKPLKCGHCDHEGVIRSEIAAHSKRAHKGIEPIIVKLLMPKDPVIIPIVRKRKAPS